MPASTTRFSRPGDYEPAFHIHMKCITGERTHCLHKYYASTRNASRHFARRKEHFKILYDLGVHVHDPDRDGGFGLALEGDGQR